MKAAVMVTRQCVAVRLIMKAIHMMPYVFACLEALLNAMTTLKTFCS